MFKSDRSVFNNSSVSYMSQSIHQQNTFSLSSCGNWILITPPAKSPKRITPLNARRSSRRAWPSSNSSTKFQINLQLKLWTMNSRPPFAPLAKRFPKSRLFLAPPGCVACNAASRINRMIASAPHAAQRSSLPPRHVKRHGPSHFTLHASRFTPPDLITFHLPSHSAALRGL